MNRFRYEALVHEFPFILQTIMEKRYGDKRDVIDCDDIKVKRVTAELLNSAPTKYSIVGSSVGVDEWERCDFVLADGTTVKGAVKPSGHSQSNYAHKDPHSWIGETVLEAIHRHNVADGLRFIVWSRGGYNIIDHHSEPNFEGTIYKPARDLPLKEAIKAAQEAARNRVKSEINF